MQVIKGIITDATRVRLLRVSQEAVKRAKVILIFDSDTGTFRVLLIVQRAAERVTGQLISQKCAT